MKLCELFMLLYFIILLFPLINATNDCTGCNSNSPISCSGSSCSANCRPKFSYDSITCYYCNFNGENFYQINTVDGSCEPKENCGNSEKIIYGSNECVSNCDANFYKMGDYCFYSQPSSSNIECNTINKICSCKYKYYRTNTNKEEYHCLGEDDECPSENNYYYNNECSSDPNICSSKKIKIEYRSNNQPIYRCSDTCYENEILTSDNAYCIDNCPALNNKKFYYPNENDQTIVQCISDCSASPYNLKELNNKCVTSCGSSYLEGNICASSCSSGIYKLIGTEKKCVDGTGCLYSQDEISSGMKRCYSSCLEIGTAYIYQKNNICYNTDGNCNYYSNENPIKKCYNTKQECKDEGYRFLQGKKCLLECNSFEYEDPTDNILKYCYASVDDCVSDGHIYYTQTPKKCYNSDCSTLDLYPQYTTESDKYLCIDCTNLKISNGYCKESCEDNECYFIDNQEIDKNLCFPISTKNYYLDEISGKNICVDDCKSKGKFYLPPSKECIQECKIIDDSGEEKKIYYDPSDNKCVEQCPVGLKYLVENSYKCIDECPEDYPYPLKDTDFDTNGHIICKRFQPCSGENYLILEDQCSSPQNCAIKGKNKINSKNICKSECEPNYNYIEKVANAVDDVYKCLKNCYKYIINSNECVEKCPLGSNFIGENNICKSNCDSDGGKFFLFSEEEDYEIYKCESSCSTGYLLTTNDNNDNQCYKNCPKSHKYLLSSQNKCYDKCISISSDSNSYPFSLSYTVNGQTINICASSCNSENPNYEEDDKICKRGCELVNSKVSAHDGKCIEKCPRSSIYKYNLDGKCVNICSGDKIRFYEEGSNNEYICVENCLDKGKYILNGQCVLPASCPNANYYYNPVKKNGIQTGEYECVLNCPKNFFKQDNSNNKICLEQCITTDYAIIDTYECVSSCNIPVSNDANSPMKYHAYKPGKTYSINTCVKDCPDDKPYLNINNECVNSCQSGLKFHKNDNPAIIGMKCIDTCPNDDYQFLSDDEKECLRQCPPGKYYINSVGQKCHSECPEEKPFHSRNNYECFSMEDCPNHFIDLTNKLCIDSCSGFNYKYEKKNVADGQLLYTVCLNDCSIYNKYLTPGKICVDSCLPSDNLEIDSTQSYKCKCKYLYYFDLTNSITVCLNENDNCAESSYKIQKVNTNECLNNCPNILSLNGDLCYDEEEPCGENENVITKTNGQKQCDCLYKFYYTDDHIKTCLASSEKCQGDRPYYIPTLKQCIDTCPPNLNYIFQNFCLNQCPKGASLVSGVCKCQNDKNWYSISDTNFECLPGKCLESHPFLVSETKQCLEKCKYTEYPNLINNECHANCDSFPNTESTEIDYYANDYQFASYTCRCKNLWYFDETKQKNICPTDIKTSCKDFSEYNFN